jgi:hypothetical protein
MNRIGWRSLLKRGSAALAAVCLAVGLFAPAIAQTLSGPLGILPASTIDRSFVVSAAPVSFTSNTTIAAVTPSIPLIAGATYNCTGHLTVTASGAGGIKVEVVTADTLSVSFVTATAISWNGGTILNNSSSTTFGAVIGATVATTSDVFISAAIVVNAAGSVALFAAQNASNATTTTIGQGSTWSCKRTA